MWGTQGSGDNQLNHPGGIAIDREGNVYVADTRNHRIMKFTSSGTFIKKWGEFGSAEGQFNTPVGIDIERQRGSIRHRRCWAGPAVRLEWGFQ